MSFWEVLILSIVEGITEFLPISSTGHMILASYAMGLEKTDGLVLFEIVTQLGATLAIVALFSKRLMTDRTTLFCVAVAFIPTGLFGLLLYPYIIPLFSAPIITLISLIVGGFLLIGFDLWKIKKGEGNRQLNWKRALLVGSVQCLAFIPGTSRSMATILAGMASGMSRREAAEFSFLLAIPTMLAASVWAIVKFEGNIQDDGLLFNIVIGSIISFFVSYGAVKVFMHFIDRMGLTFFGIYRIFFAVIYYLIFIK